MITDHETMLQIRNGDVKKLGILFEKHKKKLYNYFLLNTKDCDASEDLVQDIFMRVLKYRHTYRDNGNFEVWFFSIARNARIDYYRERSVQPEPLENIDILESNDPNPHEELEQKADIQYLQQALNNLSEEKKELIILSRYNNMRYKDIGKTLNISEGTVKVRMYRAIKELTAQFNELTGGEHHELR